MQGTTSYHKRSLRPPGQDAQCVPSSRPKQGARDSTRAARRGSISATPTWGIPSCGPVAGTSKITDQDQWRFVPDREDRYTRRTGVQSLGAHAQGKEQREKQQSGSQCPPEARVRRRDRTPPPPSTCRRAAAPPWCPVGRISVHAIESRHRMPLNFSPPLPAPRLTYGARRHLSAWTGLVPASTSSRGCWGRGEIAKIQHANAWPMPPCLEPPGPPGSGAFSPAVARP
jgi:hypothetical protein